MLLHPSIVSLWSPAGKGLTSWLLLVMFIAFLLLFHVESWVRCGTLYLIVSFPDLCRLSYFISIDESGVFVIFHKFGSC